MILLISSPERNSIIVPENKDTYFPRDLVSSVASQCCQDKRLTSWYDLQGTSGVSSHLLPSSWHVTMLPPPQPCWLNSNAFILQSSASPAVKFHGQLPPTHPNYAARHHLNLPHGTDHACLPLLQCTHHYSDTAQSSCQHFQMIQLNSACTLLNYILCL
jgi:hypothetical protein